MSRERVLDDIWANEGGVSVRVVAAGKRELRIEFTRGVGEPAVLVATLTGYRAFRLAEVLRKEWPKVPTHADIAASLPHGEHDLLNRLDPDDGVAEPVRLGPDLVTAPDRPAAVGPR